MLTGRPPFADRSARALIAAHVAAAPEPVAALRPELPPELSALVMRLLAKLPEDRPRSAHEVLRSLEREAAGGER
jgi:serine/threonine-protein kinase